ncbi:DMT family transporter [Halalkalibacter nanhaiisediminis]|uniref:Drug/metabolite transporter (DMT)-like permease n=1 Tax=Halalkalibacter nanhaiisediminis TaxID=688079 RepID=A0A562QGV2_9BACI|nr:DMT family transporter [Halalkalibacter nanhaiisediminis]TWI55893.1 drug/metabolite transporter (DMT)-like permease [Halalkalibacter nanhaiisediminis]
MNKLLYSFLVVLTTALMGSAFAIGKIGLEYSSPIFLVALRFTFAGIMMAIIVLLLKRRHPDSISDWIKIVSIGFFQTAGVMGCIFVGLQTVPSGELSILTFTNPLLVVVFGTFILKMKYNLRQWVGVLLGFVGVYITIGANLELRVGTILGICSAISWAVGTLLIKTYAKQLDTWVLTAYQMLFGGLILLMLSFLMENPHFTINVDSIFILVWLTLMASIVQFAVWFYLIQNGDPGKVSAFLFLAPFFGVISGWLLLGERLTWNVLVGAVFIFVGIFLVNWTRKGKQDRAVGFKKIQKEKEVM